MVEHYLILKGTIEGHTDMVTAISCPINNSDTIVSCSRDKSIIVWTLTKDYNTTYGIPRRRLKGHSHFVQDVVLTADGQFALSGSWDGELRLWDLNTGMTVRRFVGHTKDVLSVAFLADNGQLISASCDCTIKVWNTHVDECKYTIQEDRDNGHSDWITCVCVVPFSLEPCIVSASCDKTIKVWDLSTCKIRHTFSGHTEYVNTVCVSPDGSLLVSGGKDGIMLFWDLAKGEQIYSLEAASVIHDFCFCPDKYWICAATQHGIKIWDLESKRLVEHLEADPYEYGYDNTTTAVGNKKINYSTCLCWSADGSTLFSGYTDGLIRVWGRSGLSWTT